MPSGIHFPSKIRRKLLLVHAVTTLGTVLLVEGAALLLAAWVTHNPVFGQDGWISGPALHITLAVAGAIPVSLLLCAWASRRFSHRLQRVVDTSRAWLRGDLSLRIADPLDDELGMFAGHLDQLVTHLAQDEQDLDELREHNMRASDQVRALAVDEERDRLARELHAGVKQHLFSLAMTSSAIRAHLEGKPDLSSDLIEMVGEAETTAQAAQRELTRLIENLRPGSLEEGGLAGALKDYALLFGARDHILVYLDIQGSDSLLPPSVAEALYRVAQEALHNVARHARATRVDIRLRCLPEQVSLTLRDNGVGFDTHQGHRGLGLGNMQDRMMSTGGRLTIDSEIGSGTTVRARVGLAHSLAAQAEIARLDQERPDPRIDNWAWLGQRLVIPVGQTWPWLPVDQAHLRQPLVEPGEGPLLVKGDTGVLGFRRDYLLQREAGGALWMRVRHRRSGYRWRFAGASWTLRYVRGPSEALCAVLARNRQPLAAMQPQGRLMNMWTEFVHDGQGYRLSQVKSRPGCYVLTDRAGEELLSIERGPVSEITLHRTLPLSLVVMVTVPTVDEMASIPRALQLASEQVSS